MKNYFAYKLPCSPGETREILIAQLASFGFEGFEENDADLVASVEEGIIEVAQVDEWLNESGIMYEKAITPGQNWNALWESNFAAVVVDDFACIRAHFHQPVPGILYDIQITPKMSFGTGHHATTRQMIELMRHLPIKGSQVFDFGTGTGVLAILAAKMGAVNIEAIDNDEWSITNAQENMQVNKVEENIMLRLADTLERIAPADIVLANINKHIILKFLPDLKSILRANGCLVLSGLLIDDQDEVEGAAFNEGLKLAKRTELNNWIALIFQ